MIIINSKNSKIYKEILSLSKNNKRKREKKFFVEGKRLTDEAIKSKHRILYFVVNDSFIKNYSKSFIRIKNCNKPIYKIENSLFKNLADTNTPQGIITILQKVDNNIKSLENNSDKSFYIIIDGVKDPGNLGTIIRTAHGFNVSGIIIKKGTVDIYNNKVMRASMGSVFYVPIVYVDDIIDTVNMLKKMKIKIFATDLKSKKYLYQVDMDGPIAFIIGSEAFGVERNLLDISDYIVKIPMNNDLESYNVAIASSIFMYEVSRQKILKQGTILV